MIETTEIKMPPKKMLSVLFFQNGIIWSLVALIGIILFIILGISINFKFLILALIWIFMFVPLVVAFLYFFYGMKPLTSFNCIPHTVLFNKEEISIRFLKESEGEETQDKEEIQDKIETDKIYTLQKDSFSELKKGSDYILLVFKKEGWLYLPVKSFNSMNDFKSLIQDYTDFSLIKTTENE